MRRLALLGLMVVCKVAAGQSIADREIAGLVEALSHSGCEFERNGKWYDAASAKAHLSRKYDWLRKRHLANTSELFIARAASASSISGKPYHVRCPGRPSVESAVWFKAELQHLRGQRAPVRR